MTRPTLWPSPWLNPSPSPWPASSSTSCWTPWPTLWLRPTQWPTTWLAPWMTQIVMSGHSCDFVYTYQIFAAPIWHMLLPRHLIWPPFQPIFSPWWLSTKVWGLLVLGGAICGQRCRLWVCHCVVLKDFPREDIAGGSAKGSRKRKSYNPFAC